MTRTINGISKMILT